MNTLYIVVPCYNEQEILPITIPQFIKILESLISDNLISEQSRVVFVNDGSKDDTWSIIKNATENNLVIGINLAGNVGHQNALMAGLEYSKQYCDMSISIDADLQDDINIVKDMVKKYQDGADIVFGVRNDRQSDTLFKRFTAQAFYKLMHTMGIKSVYNHADYRLMNKKSLEALCEYGESNLFLRGIVAQLGFVTDIVYYSRKERVAGESKYPLKKMLSFAWNGITSFSVKPISVLMTIGCIIIFCSLLAFAYSLVSYLFGNVIRGWTSLIISIWFLGGVQLFAIGMIGQYVGKTYIETKKRPRYHIESIIGNN